jgi:peptidoglycan/LPS O-acetylase OafA/YrhL
MHIPALDGWRALAIIAVICFHGRFAFFPHPSLVRSISEYGYLGVDAFFAISGFLICTILIREYDANQSIDLRAFYIRRFFRIIPSYVAALAGICVVAGMGFIHLQSWEIPSCLMFLRNYEPTVAPPGGPYDAYGFYTVHLWSLSLEEHFYLIWASLLALLEPRRAVKAALILAATVVLWRFADGHYQIAHRLIPSAEMGTRTDTRLDALLWGCMAALLFSRIQSMLSHRWWSWAWIPLSLYLVLLERYHLPLFQLHLALLFPCLMMSTVLFPRNALSRVLELPLVRWIGGLSYSVYLRQQLFLQPPRGIGSLEYTSGFYRLQQFPLNILGILACACLSHYLFERPMIRFGRRLNSRRPVASSAVVPVQARPAQPAWRWIRLGFSMSAQGTQVTGSVSADASATVAGDRRVQHSRE